MEFRIAQSSFEAIEDGKVIGWLSFDPGEDSVSYTHTIVPAEYGGRGVGTALVEHALEHAERNGWTIVPRCHFVRSYLATHPQFNHLVRADARETLTDKE
ncbi:MAG: N-acetyltransferase [Propionibacteriaceae bacterium]|jgi:predicted GNAT family acetyltransferase|nr:N-acetyltransferase [Propionibacteriaceae bacterium]